MSGRSRASSGKDFRRSKRSQGGSQGVWQGVWLNHNSSSSDEYSGVCVRSSFSDISVTDLISFLRDVQKFLDRLNHEDLSDDCREIKKSLTGRIDFYTKKSRSDWMHQSSSNLNLNRESFDRNLQRSSRLSLNEPPPLPARLHRSSFSMETEQSSTEESSYDDKAFTDTTNYSSNTDWEEEMKPVMTSTPRKLRTMDSSFQSTTQGEEGEEEDDEYDLVEIKPCQSHEVSQETPEVSLRADSSARTVTAQADYTGYIYKKESIFKSTRYWAAVAQSRLYLYPDINSVNCKECHLLEDAYLKTHKKEPKRFMVQLSGKYKNKNSKQEYSTDNPEIAQIWIQHLENAIATAGKTPKTMKKLSSIKLVESLPVSRETDVGDDSDDDEDYDVVEVTGGHNVSLPVLPSQPLPTIYDVPKSHGPEEVTRSRSSWSLDKEVRYKQPLPLPSPRKCLTEGRSLPATPSGKSPSNKSNVSNIYDTNVSNRAVRNLFNDVDQRREETKPNKSPDFSSKTLKPKKATEEKAGGGTMTRFRPRNKSESVKQPEAVYNELSLILERRRHNLETKPTIPNRPKNLTLDTKDSSSPSFPPYSKVNKVSRPHKESVESRHNVPTKSFLHSFAQSGKLGQLQSAGESKNTFNTFKGW